MNLPVDRICFLEPIPEIYEAAKYLDEAVSAHILGQHTRADELIRLADMNSIAHWGYSLWGKQSPYLHVRKVESSPSIQHAPERARSRMPNAVEKRALLARDGYHCRFCGIPVIRKEVRNRFKKLYPEATRWGKTSDSQHAAFLTMWAQYDHLLPHSRGGTNDIHNMVITCAPCNYGRVQYTLDEVGLANPLLRESTRSSWDGLERLLVR